MATVSEQAYKAYWAYALKAAASDAIEVPCKSQQKLERSKELLFASNQLLK